MLKLEKINVELTPNEFDNVIHLLRLGVQSVTGEQLDAACEAFVAVRAKFVVAKQAALLDASRMERIEEVKALGDINGSV